MTWVEKKTEEQQIAGVFKCVLSRIVTRACAASIYSSARSIQNSWLCVFLFMNKKKGFCQGLANIKTGCLLIMITGDQCFSDNVTAHLKSVKKNDQNDQKMPEKTDEKLYFFYKVLTALESGERRGDDLARPQKSDLWRFLLCSFKFIIRTAQSRSACIWYDAALLPYCSRDLGLWDVLPQPLHQCFMIPAINDRLTAGCGVSSTGEW